MKECLNYINSYICQKQPDAVLAPRTAFQVVLLRTASELTLHRLAYAVLVRITSSVIDDN